MCQCFHSTCRESDRFPLQMKTSGDGKDFSNSQLWLDIIISTKFYGLIVKFSNTEKSGIKIHKKWQEMGSRITVNQSEKIWFNWSELASKSYKNTLIINNTLIKWWNTWRIALINERMEIEATMTLHIRPLHTFVSLSWILLIKFRIYASFQRILYAYSSYFGSY